MRPRATHGHTQTQMSKLQLMCGGQISKQTGLSSVGINYVDEVNRQMEEQQFATLLHRQNNLGPVGATGSYGSAGPVGATYTSAKSIRR